MAALSEEVIHEFKEHVGPLVFSTVDANGIPNSIYVTCASLFNPETIIIADNRFDKTKKNILNGSKGSLLFITEEKISFQVKGRIEYHESGEYFDDMKKWNPTKLPGHAAAVIKIEEIYSGASKL
ncbi:MAG: pyridoxamine 5'-phosphate oxidase family protein [Melioribacteraceae bacterium]|nr:pyridoxamine 5'-phosphate oxidase family protein [Melioribacteraceae bacterium]